MLLCDKVRVMLLCDKISVMLLCDKVSVMLLGYKVSIIFDRLTIVIDHLAQNLSLKPMTKASTEK